MVARTDAGRRRAHARRHRPRVRRARGRDRRGLGRRANRAGEQRGHKQDRAFRGVPGGTLARGDRRESDRRLPLLPGRRCADARPGRRVDRERRLDLGLGRNARPGGLLLEQGGARRPDACTRRRMGLARRPRQRRLAGLRPYADDRKRYRARSRQRGTHPRKDARKAGLPSPWRWRGSSRSSPPMPPRS